MSYNSSRLQQETRYLNVRTIIEMVEMGRLYNNPPFGFLPTVSNIKQSQIIEFLILGLPLEIIYAEQDVLGETKLLSGYDIISSICNFVSNKFILQGLKFLTHLEKLKYSQIDYVEKKHFEQMQIGLNFISYDSNPLLKCIFIEKINSVKYSKDSLQLAINIVFHNVSQETYAISQFFLTQYANREEHILKRKKILLLKLQKDISYCLLILYVYENFNRLNNVSMESYSYSRSHFIDEPQYQINYDDNLDYALMKLMLIYDDNMDKSNFKKDINFIYNIFKKNKIDINTIGKNFYLKDTDLIKDTPSLIDFVYDSLTGNKISVNLKYSMSVFELLRGK